MGKMVGAIEPESKFWQAEAEAGATQKSTDSALCRISK
jgi:hypothetical protein